MAKNRKTRIQKAYENEGRFAKNRLAKHIKHLKAHPNDTQCERADASASYKRKKPMGSLTSKKGKSKSINKELHRMGIFMDLNNGSI